MVLLENKTEDTRVSSPLSGGKGKLMVRLLSALMLGLVVGSPVLSATGILSGTAFAPSVVHADDKEEKKDEKKDEKSDESKDDKKEPKEKDVENRTDNDTGGNLLDSPLTSALLANGLSNEDFTGLDTNYLYRGYTDIADYSRMYYGNMMGDNIASNGSIVFNIGSWSESLTAMFPNAVDAVGKAKGSSRDVSSADIRSSMVEYLSLDKSEKVNHQTLLERARLGFINDRIGTAKDGSIDQRTFRRVFAPISSNTISKASTQDISKVKVGDEVGLNEDYFILSKKNFNDHNTTLQEQMATANASTTGTAIPQEDAVSLSSFALFTESPFYYWSWGLYDNGLSTEAGSSGEFKTMMLENNDSYFYNYQIDPNRPGYGGMKDFLDFGSLFTVTIPYLREANKTLLQWDDTYGTRPYNGYGKTKDDLDKIQDKATESYYKTWFNYSADNAYRTYTAWVDYLYSLDIAKPETIKYGGKEQRVSEPMNPASYKIRPMVFSESEMLYYGMKESDLTRVEKKLLEIAREVRKDWLQVMNYYTLDDVVLNTATAMIATFDFNRAMSQTGFNQQQVVFEPQNFELKTFGWDAYLRMILQNATGESIGYNKKLKSDIYEIVSEKDGTVTLLMMWFNSFVVVYVVPTLLILVMCSLPVAMILSVFASFVKQDKKMISAFAKECMLPFLTVLGVNLLLAYTVSILMGSGGYDIVTGELGNTQTFNSPRSTMGVLIFITLASCAFYYMAVHALFKGLWTNAKIVSIPVKAGVEMTANLAVGNLNKVKEVASGVSSSVDRAVGGTSTSRRGSGGLARNAYEQSKSNLGKGYKGLNKTANGLRKTGGKTTRKASEATERANRLAKDKLDNIFNKDKEKPDLSKKTQDKLNNLDHTTSKVVADKRARDKLNGIFGKDK